MYSEQYNDDADYIIQQMIYDKNSYEPYFVNGKDIKVVLTDMDHFPYRRFFRGVYDDPVPIIHSRFAGYRPYMHIGCNLHCKQC